MKTPTSMLDEDNVNSQKSNIDHSGKNSITESQESTGNNAAAFSVPFTDFEQLVSSL